MIVSTFNFICVVTLTAQIFAFIPNEVNTRASIARRISPTMVAESPVKPVKLDKVNIIKLNSKNLREPVKSEMANDEIFINHDAYQILKFHGSYMQDNRENRKKGAEKDYSFMLRLKMPAGECPPELYQLLDDLSNDYGHGHLRLTTRQTFQLHGVAKNNLKHVIKSIMNVGSSTVGGCGDVNRNIMTTPAPITDKPEYVYARQYTKLLAELLRPMSAAFTELWLDGEKAATIEYWRKDINGIDIDAAMLKDNGNGIILDHPVEPLYGDLYFPRKFKIGVTVPGDNSIDIYTNDIGLVVITDPLTGRLEGFNVMAGGGLGRTHGKDTTFARAADHLGFVPADQILECCKAILAAQRDHGNREVRANARMKYLVHTLGPDQFRTLVESYMGQSMQPWRQMPDWKYSDWMGWHEQGEGKWFYGFNIEQGRVIDRENGPKIKTAIRALADTFRFPLICTPNQSVIIKDISKEQKREVESLLSRYGILPIEQIDPLIRLAIACPALPMCGLAITEAERRMPSFLTRIRSLLDELDLGDEEIMVRMTGCPNGCARPYMAELAFVGDGIDTYQLWIGGTPSCDRVAYPLMDKMKESALESTIRPILKAYKAEMQVPMGYKGFESFGEFCARLGKEGVQKAVSSVV
jgi:sulfite reductase (ferredoxin)